MRPTTTRRSAALYRDPRRRAGDGPAGAHPGGAAALRARRRSAPAARSDGAGARARRVADRTQAATSGSSRGGSAGAGAGVRARPPHPHAVRRAPRLHQRRGVPRRRPRCDADAPAGRPAPARRGSSPARATRRASCWASGSAPAGASPNAKDSTRRRHDRRHIGPIGSRAEFLDAVRKAFTTPRQPARARSWLVDPDFADWPLNERAVIDSLSRWVDSRRALIVLAHNFDEVARRQLRCVEWRRQWAHVVQCRNDPDLEAEQIPTLLLVPGHTCDAGPRSRALSRYGVESTGRSDRVPGKPLTRFCNDPSRPSPPPLSVSREIT